MACNEYSDNFESIVVDCQSCGVRIDLEEKKGSYYTLRINRLSIEKKNLRVEPFPSKILCANCIQAHLPQDVGSDGRVKHKG